MTKLMTLAEALATGRPFRHKTWSYFLDPSNENSPRYAGEICMSKSVYEPVWEVEPEEKPPMRVWTNAKCEILITSEIPTQWNDDLCWVDITESLASALAPFIKELLK